MSYDNEQYDRATGAIDALWEVRDELERTIEAVRFDTSDGDVRREVLLSVLGIVKTEQERHRTFRSSLTWAS